MRQQTVPWSHSYNRTQAIKGISVCIISNLTKYKNFRELAKALINGEIQYREKDIYKIKPVFRLHPPRKGHRGNIKKHFNEGGTLGDVGIYINQLIHKML